MSNSPGSDSHEAITGVSALFIGDRSFAEGLRLGIESPTAAEGTLGSPEDFSLAVGKVVGASATQAGVDTDTLVSAAPPRQVGRGGSLTIAELRVVTELMESGQSSSPATIGMARTLSRAVEVITSFGPGEMSNDVTTPADLPTCLAAASRLTRLAEIEAMRRQAARHTDDLASLLEGELY